MLLAAVLTGCATLTTSPTVAASSLTAPLSSKQAAKIGFASYWLTGLDVGQQQHIASVTRAGNNLIVEQRPVPLVCAISLTDGSNAWTKIVSNRTQVIYPPVLRQGKLYINTEIRLYTLDAASGTIQSFVDLPSTVTGCGAIVDGRIIFGAADGHLFAVDLNNHQIVWRYLMPAPVVAPLATNGSDVLATDANGNYAMFAGDTGNFLWQRRSFAAIKARPVFDGKRALVPSTDQNLYAANINNGKDDWVYRTQYPLTASPVVIHKTIYLPIPGHDLVALDPKTGNMKWSLQHAARPVALIHKRLLATLRNQIQMINPASGEVDTRLPVHGLYQVVAGPHGSLIVITDQGVIQRLNPAE